MKVVFLLIILCIFAVSEARRKKGRGGGGGGGQCNPTTSRTAPGDFEYYVFASQWVGGACYENEQCRPADNISAEFWNIHGLWPSDGKPKIEGQKKEYYGCCSGDDYNVQLSEAIQSDLKTYWPSLYTKNSDNWFHEHEWTKHGTCSGLGQSDFFSATLNLAKNLALYNKLKEQGIVPRDEPYDCKEIVGALEKAFGDKKFDIASRGKNKQKYLSEVHICVDRDLAKVVDCIDGNSRSCKGKVYYPVDNPALDEEENIFTYDDSDSGDSEANVASSPVSNDDVIDLDANSSPSSSNDDSVGAGSGAEATPGSFDL